MLFLINNFLLIIKTVNRRKFVVMFITPATWKNFDRRNSNFRSDLLSDMTIVKNNVCHRLFRKQWIFWCNAIWVNNILFVLKAKVLPQSEKVYVCTIQHLSWSTIEHLSWTKKTFNNGSKPAYIYFLHILFVIISDLPVWREWLLHSFQWMTCHNNEWIYFCIYT